MKKFLALMLVFSMLLSLAACGEKEEDPNAGMYEAVSATALGITLTIDEIYEGETWIELKTGGKGTIALDGEEFPMKWELDGEDITVTIDGVDSTGTLEDGIITIDILDMGLEMVFVHEDAELIEEDPGLLDGDGYEGITYYDAGYWELVRIDSEDPESVVSEEDMAMVKGIGITMYLELLPDGTGTIFIDDAMALQWHDGTLDFTEDGMSVSYTLEDGELKLDMIESIMVFRKSEKPEPVVSEMEQAGFVNFMEVGVPYAYTTCTSDDLNIPTIGEATVTSYEIFESAEGYAAEEGYEWRVVKMEVRFYDENTGKYGCSIQSNFNDYYNAALFDDTSEVVKETDSYEAYAATVIHNGQEADVYVYWNYLQWSDWYTGAAGNDEIICYLQWDFLVPVGYDGCVAGLHDYSLEWLDGTYITDYDPSNFLLFRLN